MKKRNIVTSLAIDPNDSSFNAQLYYLSHRKKREIYWKCCVTFFCTSIRQNPEANHILFTNDKNDIIININIKDFLKKLGVQIIELSFEKFKPRIKHSTHYLLTLYVLEVYHFLGKRNNEFNICLDSDCIWINPYPETTELNKDDCLIIYDVYNFKDPLTKIHGINQKDLGIFYKKIDPDYPNKHPIWYGGEFVAGSSEIFKIVSREIEHYFEQVNNNFDVSPKLPNRMKIFDGDELPLSLVYNKLTNKIVEASSVIKRIWTNPKNEENNIEDENIFELSIWHMIGEKKHGIPLLFEKIIDLDSEFWKLQQDELKNYLGLYFGFPTRKFVPELEGNIQTLLPKIVGKLRELINRFRH